jgi:hypothetical protein
MNDAVANAALWVILAAAVALLVLGCWATRRVPEAAATQDPDQQVDRAA